MCLAMCRLESLVKFRALKFRAIERVWPCAVLSEVQVSSAGASMHQFDIVDVVRGNCEAALVDTDLQATTLSRILSLGVGS